MTRPPEKELNAEELDTLFAASDSEGVLPSVDLVARILADAEREQAVARAEQRPWHARLQDMLGGWRGMSGLAGAVATGLVIGMFPPDMLLLFTEALIGAELSAADYVPRLGEVAFDG